MPSPTTVAFAEVVAKAVCTFTPLPLCRKAVTLLHLSLCHKQVGQCPFLGFRGINIGIET